MALLEQRITIGDSSFLIRPFNQNDDLDEFKRLYLQCDNVLAKGIMEEDERLQRIGRNHVNRVFNSDFSSIDTMNETYGKGKGQFWFLIDVPKGKIIGSIALLQKKIESENSETEGELLRMCVSPDYRRIGLGYLLVQQLLAYAVANGFTRITLTTPSSNTSAIQMYQKAGFVFKQSNLVECGEDGELDISTFEREFVIPPAIDCEITSTDKNIT